MGAESFLAQKNLGSGSRTRNALKYMWFTVLGLKDLINSNDVANNLSMSFLELQDSLVRGTSLLPDHKICLLLECKSARNASVAELIEIRIHEQGYLWISEE